MMTCAEEAAEEGARGDEEAKAAEAEAQEEEFGGERGVLSAEAVCFCGVLRRGPGAMMRPRWQGGRRRRMSLAVREVC
jgi:hypothetical protein